MSRTPLTDTIAERHVDENRRVAPKAIIPARIVRQINELLKHARDLEAKLAAISTPDVIEGMIEHGTHRDRKLLDLAHDAPCMLLLGAPGCGRNRSVPCHSDMLRHGRGGNHKSHDCLAVAGCPPCHSIFTREKLGREGYEEKWRIGHERYTLYLWRNKLVKVA